MRAEQARVLMTADAVGGVWTYALDLARALADRGVYTTLATMGPRPSTHQIAAAAPISGLHLETSDFKLEWMHDPGNDVAAAGEWLLDLERRIGPQVVHLNGFAHGALPFGAPVVCVGHSCLLSWADAVPGVLEPAALDAYAAMVRPGIRGADSVVAPSAAMLDALQRHYGPLPQTEVIPNGRRGGVFEPGRKEPFIFTAGRLWDPAKNVKAVIAAAKRLPWPVAVAGPDTLGSSTWQGPAQPGVRALGVLPEHELAGWLARASLFVLPARYEPFGLLPLEAGLSGCALVLGDLPSLREVWGDAATYVNPGDPDALRQTLATLIASPATLSAGGAAARACALTYTAERMADRYLSLYEAARSAKAGRIACAS